MTFVSFASGSSGNCYLLTEGRAAVLLDTGISLRRIKTGLARRALTPDDLSAVLITHEHSDHVAGLPMLLKYYKNVKVYAPQTVAHALERAAAGLEGRIVPIPVGESVALKNFTLTAFPTMHDTPESVGYVLTGKDARFGVCTDTGCVTAEMLDALAGCDAAVIECYCPGDPSCGGMVEGWTVVDCCVATEAARAQWEAIFATQLEGLPVLRVIVTHMHPDHIGLAHWLCQRWQAPLWISATDYYTARLACHAGPGLQQR